MLNGPLPEGTIVGGVEKWVYELAKCLTSEGNEVHIMGHNSLNSPTSFRQGDLHFHAEPSRYFGDMFLRAKCVSKHIIDLHKHCKFDLIHGHVGDQMFGAILAKRSLNIPIVTTVHAVLDEYFSSQREIAMIMPKRFLRTLPRALTHVTSVFIREFLAYRYSDILVSVSHYGLRKVKQLYNTDLRKAYVVYGGVSPRPIIGRASEKASGNKRLLFVGRVEPRKGLHYLIKALPLMSKEAKVTVVGHLPEADEYTAYLRNLITKLNVQKRVEFAGIANDEQKWKLYNLSDVFVVPSVHEALSLVVLEAMNSGLPVVASNVGGMPEVVKNGRNGLLFNARDFKSLAEKVVGLLDDNRLRERMGSNARRSVYRMTWSTVAREYMSIYDKCVSR
jgi:glycosyltransferase involved in cell wall biosynthesis